MSNKSSRKQAAKDVAKATGKQVTDTLPTAVMTAAHAAQAGVDLAKGNIVGAASNTIKAVSKGAKTIEKTVKHGWNMLKNAVKVIFNDENWWNKFGIKPSINPTRPMNPKFNTTITTDPTMGSILKVFDLVLNWNGLYESEMFNTIVVKYYELIRNNLRSNLPYSQNEVKQYLVNAIALKAVAAQIKRNLSFRSFSPSDSPNSYQLFRKRPNTYSGYGATYMEDIAYLSDTNIASAIVEWNTAVDIMSSIYLPPHVNEFIDHYFGLVFSTDADGSNSQYISTVLQSVDYYDNKSQSLVNLNVNNINPTTLIEMLNNLLANYGMIIADLKHSGIQLISIVEPKYEQLTTTVYYDVSMLQALANAYTSDSAVQNDNYIRLDTIPNSKDFYTTFVMLGALQSQFNNNPLNLPLLTPICMSIKVENDSELNWESTFVQNNSLDLSELDYFAINICTDISEDTYFTYSTANTTVVVPISGTNNSTQSYANIKYDFNISKGTYAPSRIVSYNKTGNGLKLAVPLFYINKEPSKSTGSSMVVAVFAMEKTSPQIYYDNFIVGEFEGIGYVTANNYSLLRNMFTDPGDYEGLIRPTIMLGTYIEMITLDPALPTSAIKATGNCTIAQGTDVSFHENITISMNDLSITNAIVGGIDAIPANGTYETQVVLDSNVSIINMYATSAENLEAGIVTSSGYVGMSEWIVQQLDFHIPMVVQHRYTTNIDGNVKSTVVGTNLLKESYIPYWYNIQDILPVAYSMMNSLLSPSIVVSSKRVK